MKGVVSIVRTSDERQEVSRARIERDQRGLETRDTETAQTVPHGSLCGILHFRHERRLHLPVRRVVVSDEIPELLPQEFLGVAMPAGRGGCCRPHAQPLPTRGLFLRRGDLPLLAHAPQHDEASSPRVLEPVPGGIRGRRSNDAGQQRCLAQRQVGRRLAEGAPRHRLDAVDAAAEVNAVHVELENLPLRKEDLEHQRQYRLLGFPAVGAAVGQEQRARQLLRDRAATLSHVAPDVVNDRSGQADGIDSRMQVVAVILDGDDRVLERGGNPVERHVLSLFVEAKPGTVVGVVEHRVADATIELVDGPGVAERPQSRHRDARNGNGCGSNKQPAPDGSSDELLQQDWTAMPLHTRIS